MRTVFALLPIGTEFVFIGNPVLFRKETHFEAKIIKSPYGFEDYDDKPITHCNAIDKAFQTDSIVDVVYKG